MNPASLYNIPVSSRTYDAIVVGAGIVGAACASQLARDGLAVALCEAAPEAGPGATAAAMGHIAVMDGSPAQFALTRYSQQLWRELAAELPAAAEYRPCGCLWVASNAEEMDQVHRQHAFYSRHGLPVHVLGPADLRSAEPHLRPSLAGALLMAADSVCNPPAVARYLTETVLQHKGDVFFNCPVLSVSDRGVQTASGHTIPAALVIVATGTAAIQLIPGLPLLPRKGHLFLAAPLSDFLCHQVIELGYRGSAGSIAADSVAFNVQPRAGGQILVGSSRQFGSEDPAIDPCILAKMQARAVEFMPALQNVSVVRAWTGFRAATPDKLPLIGRCPGYRNVYLATGHEGLGISTSHATARLLADHIAARPSSIDPTPYRPDRSFPEQSS